MVHFPPLPSPAYVFSGRYSGMSQSGFPHSEIPGSKPACGSPRLIAACHVLRRLLAPRHPPHALSSLTIKLAESKVHGSPHCAVHPIYVPDIQLSKNLADGEYKAEAFQSERPGFALAVGGEYRDRTGDLLVANQALSQLS